MIAVDLDGTLLHGNSFTMFTAFLLRTSLSRGKIATAARLCGWSGLRKLKFITHRRLKWHVMKIADSLLSEDDYAVFAGHLSQRVNSQVAAYISGKEDVLLATAASEEYVAPFAQAMGIKKYVATRRPVSGRFADYVECRGEIKVRRAKAASAGGAIDEALTDHTDDMPLLMAATSRRILVNPSPTTYAAVSMAGLSAEVWQ